MSEVLSIYTPSNLKPETLEEIFVQRHKLLKKSVQWIEESIVTKKKNHLLFVGSRGSGKTHLISMIINRLKAKEKLESKMVLVWLGEDDVITNFLDFVLSILRTMAEDSEFNLDCLEVAKGKGHNEVVDIILDSIMEQLEDRTLLVVKENMSDVFAGLKDDGQKKLRAFLQEKKNMVLFTSSQQLFEGVSSRDAAFFGFFDIHHLKPLSVDDAMELIAKVSKLKGDQELYDFVHTAQGRYRVRALHHLAGGNQRLYMNLLEFLTMESLDNLVSALNKLADDLTPYFQERIKSLPPQQGKIVQKLCDIEGALPVKYIAEELFIGERSVAKQLGELLKKNYVIADKRGKLTYYEIAEPLMRLSLEVKHNHGKPLKMLVLLLRAWFSDKELQVQLFEKMDTLSFDYIEEALNIDKMIINTLCDGITKELMKCLKEEDYKGMIKYASELLSSQDNNLYEEYKILLLRATAYQRENKIELALNDYIRASDSNKLDESQIDKLYFLISTLQYQSKDYNNSLKYISKTLECDTLEEKIQISCLVLRAKIYENTEKINLAIEDYTKLISLNKNKIDEYLIDRSTLYSKQNKLNLAIEDVTSVIHMNTLSTHQRVVALASRASEYMTQCKFDLALDDLTNALKLKDISEDMKLAIKYPLVNVYYEIHEFQKAHKTLESMFELRKSLDIEEIFFIADIVSSIAKDGYSVWKEEIKFMLSLFDKHKAMEHLSNGVIHSINAFIEDKTLLLSFNKWQELWQEEAGEYEFMQIPLKVLRVVRDALEDKNDKPLFELPKEIRDLVLPMIEDTIK